MAVKNDPNKQQKKGYRLVLKLELLMITRVHNQTEYTEFITPPYQFLL